MSLIWLVSVWYPSPIRQSLCPLWPGLLSRLLSVSCTCSCQRVRCELGSGHAGSFPGSGVDRCSRCPEMTKLCSEGLARPGSTAGQSLRSRPGLSCPVFLRWPFELVEGVSVRVPRSLLGLSCPAFLRWVIQGICIPVHLEPRLALARALLLPEPRRVWMGLKVRMAMASWPLVSEPARAVLAVVLAVGYRLLRRLLVGWELLRLVADQRPSELAVCASVPSSALLCLPVPGIFACWQGDCSSSICCLECSWPWLSELAGPAYFGLEGLWDRQ